MTQSPPCYHSPSVSVFVKLWSVPTMQSLRHLSVQGPPTHIEQTKKPMKKGRGHDPCLAGDVVSKMNWPNCHEMQDVETAHSMQVNLVWSHRKTWKRRLRPGEIWILCNGKLAHAFQPEIGSRIIVWWCYRKLIMNTDQQPSHSLNLDSWLLSPFPLSILNHFSVQPPFKVCPCSLG